MRCLRLFWSAETYPQSFPTAEINFVENLSNGFAPVGDNNVGEGIAMSKFGLHM